MGREGSLLHVSAGLKVFKLQLFAGEAVQGGGGEVLFLDVQREHCFLMGKKTRKGFRQATVGISLAAEFWEGLISSKLFQSWKTELCYHVVERENNFKMCMS